MVKLKSCLKWLFVGLIVLFIYAPILLLTVYSFNETERITEWKGFSLDHYKYFFSFDHEPLPIVLQTLLLAVIVATLSTLLGTIGAIGIFYSKKTHTFYIVRRQSDSRYKCRGCHGNVLSPSRCRASHR